MNEMPTFTRRKTGLDNPDDYEFLVDGKASGRCYYSMQAGALMRWTWTLYGSSARGVVDTLEEAQTEFKTAWTARSPQK